MTDTTLKTHAQAGDLAQLVSAQNKYFLVRLNPKGQMQTHRGNIKHSDLIGIPWGSQVLSHIGSPFVMLQPSLADVLLETKRNTQIMYPKDIGFVLLTMNIGHGQRVLEAGTGSGGLTTAFAHAVGPEGRVFSYDVRLESQQLAKKNLKRVELADRVTFKHRDIAEGFDEYGVDALFLDVPNPQDYLAQVRKALKPGGFFGSILPTSNQVVYLLSALRHERFAYIEICETLLRYYKAIPERLRPADRMIAHTGYLIFARPILPVEKSPEAPATTAESAPEESAPADEEA